MERTGSTSPVSMVASSIHELYKLRVLVIAFGSTVPFDGIDDIRSEQNNTKDWRAREFTVLPIMFKFNCVFRGPPLSVAPPEKDFIIFVFVEMIRTSGGATAGQ